MENQFFNFYFLTVNFSLNIQDSHIKLSEHLENISYVVNCVLNFIFFAYFLFYVKKRVPFCIFFIVIF